MTDRNFLRKAYSWAATSPDRSTQNGAIVVYKGEILGAGCNRPPPGIAVTEERLTVRPLKYKVINHAEDAALFDAVRNKNGDRLEGATLYCPWVACSKCACVIIALGISRIVTDARLARKTYDSTCGWVNDVKIGMSLLTEAGIQVDLIDEALFVKEPVRFEGKLWSP